MINRSKQNWAHKLKLIIYALYLASRDSRSPSIAKFIIGLVLAYALSPIDLIPDFIPLIGYLDDLILLPIGIWLAIRLIPQDVWIDSQKVAAVQIDKLPHNRRAASVIVCIWILLAAACIFWLWPD